MSIGHYELYGITLALAWFFIVNAATSTVITAAMNRFERSATERPALWLALRLSPAAVGAAFVTVVFLPSYWKYEGRETVEGFDVTLTLLAAGAVALIALGSVRAGAAWVRAARRTGAWMRTARPLALPCTHIKAFSIDADAPIMALVGVVRPRLLVTRGLIDALTREELEASVAHELHHWRALDNLKRLAMRAAPDVLAMLPASRAIERLWASAAEHSADRHASLGSAAMRCALASALVKVARLTAGLPPTTEPISTLMGGGEIASRVQHLLDDRAPASGRPHRPAAEALLVAIALAFAAEYIPVLQAVHDLTELLVRSLP